MTLRTDSAMIGFSINLNQRFSHEINRREKPHSRYSWNCAGDSVVGATSKSGSYQIACGEEECFILNIDNGVAKDLGIPFQVEVEVASKMSVVCDVKKMFTKNFTEELNL